MARVLISMPEEFLKEVDNMAGEENRTRSELIREAMRQYMKKSRVSNPIKAQQNAARLERML